MVRPVLMNKRCPRSWAFFRAAEADSGILPVISLKMVPSISKNNAFLFVLMLILHINVFCNCLAIRFLLQAQFIILPENPKCKEIR